MLLPKMALSSMTRVPFWFHLSRLGFRLSQIGVLSQDFVDFFFDLLDWVCFQQGCKVLEIPYSGRCRVPFAVSYPLLYLASIFLGFGFTEIWILSLAWIHLPLAMQGKAAFTMDMINGKCAINSFILDLAPPILSVSLQMSVCLYGTNFLTFLWREYWNISHWWVICKHSSVFLWGHMMALTIFKSSLAIISRNLRLRLSRKAMMTDES